MLQRVNRLKLMLQHVNYFLDYAMSQVSSARQESLISLTAHCKLARCQTDKNK